MKHPYITLSGFVHTVAKVILFLCLVAPGIGQTAFQLEKERAERLKLLVGTWQRTNTGGTGYNQYEINSAGYVKAIHADKRPATGVLKEESPGVFVTEIKHEAGSATMHLTLKFNTNGELTGECTLVRGRKEQGKWAIEGRKTGNTTAK